MTGLIVGSLGLVFGLVSLVRSANLKSDLKVANHNIGGLTAGFSELQHKVEILNSERFVVVPRSDIPNKKKQLTVQDVVNLILEASGAKFEETTRRLTP